MKVLIIAIIMIVSSCVSAQIDNIWQEIKNDIVYKDTVYYTAKPYTSTESPIRNEWITYQDNPFDDIGTLIEQYQAYKLECYNDSTIRYINPIPEGHNHVHYVNWYTEAQCNDNHTRTYWKHKTPTFDGFMNYFNKKTYK